MLRSLLVLLALIPLYSTAQIVYEKTLRQDGDETGEAIVHLDDGSVIIGSNSYNLESAECDPLFVKADAYGELVWTVKMEEAGNQYVEDLVLTNDNHFLVFGTAPEPFSQSDATKDFFLIKMDFDGNKVWSRRYGTPGADDAVKIVPLSDGYLLTGSTMNLHGVEDYYLIKIDAESNIVWEKTIEAQGRSFGTDCIVDANDNILVTGFSTPSKSGEEQMTVMQLNKDGEIVWNWYAEGIWEHSYGRHIFHDGTGGYWVHAFADDAYRMVHFTNGGVNDRIELAQEEAFQFPNANGFVQLARTSEPGQSELLTYDNDMQLVQRYDIESFVPWAAAADAHGNLTISGDKLSEQQYDDIHLVKVSAIEAVDNVDGQLSQDHMQVYPNPSLDGRYFFKYELTSVKSFTLEMYDLTGRVVYSKRVRNNQGLLTIDLQNAQPGTYIIKAWKGKDELYTERVVLLD